MSERETPETVNAYKLRDGESAYTRELRILETMTKLERERDEAREKVAKYRAAEKTIITPDGMKLTVYAQEPPTGGPER